MRALADPGRSVRSARWADLRLRTLSAVLLAPLALACVWLGGGLFLALMAAAAAGLALEWVWLCRADPRVLPGLAVPALVLLAGVAAAFGHASLGLGVLVVGAVLLWRPFGRISLAAGVAYAGIATLALLWLRGGPQGRGNVIFVLLVVWGSDIGAYLIGRMIGGKKLAPSISPGKTWSGSAGGLVVAILVGIAAAHAMAPGYWVQAAAAAAWLGVVSQVGDLLESGVKRHFGVKDSGRLIPGHGGLLDRLDGLMAAAPAAVCLMLATGRGGFLWQ